MLYSTAIKTIFRFAKVAFQWRVGGFFFWEKTTKTLPKQPQKIETRAINTPCKISIFKIDKKIQKYNTQ